MIVHFLLLLYLNKRDSGFGWHPKNTADDVGEAVEGEKWRSSMNGNSFSLQIINKCICFATERIYCVTCPEILEWFDEIRKNTLSISVAKCCDFSEVF